jgi:DNA-binding SARP family transcriptional activator
MLGGFDARADDRAALNLPARRAQALLAALAHQAGRERSRDDLAALIWCDRPPVRARHNLRQALVTLKRSIPETCADALWVTRSTVGLRAERVDVDVAEFERLAWSDEPGAQERAAALYRGDFLAGLDIGQGLFEDWLMSERARMRELVLQALAKLLACHLRRDEIEQGIQTALRILSIDPLQEAVHRTLMRLFMRQQRCAAALLQYRACADLLRRDLQLTPEPETQRLYEQIIQRRPRSADSNGLRTIGALRNNTPDSSS